MRLEALAVIAPPVTKGAAHAADPCIVVARKTSEMKSDDACQATTLLFDAARLGCEREARTCSTAGDGPRRGSAHRPNRQARWKRCRRCLKLRETGEFA
jgi:hypothetical protein